MTSQPDMFGAPDVGGERHAFDAYDTPDWCTRALIAYLGPRLAGIVWEPCAGAGAIVDVLRAHAEYVYSVAATDIAPRREDIGEADFLRCSSVPNAVGCAWIVTNPPYSAETGTATQCVQHALKALTHPNAKPHRGVAMLLRIGWQEPCEDRAELFTQNPPTDLVTLPRVHYIGAPRQNNQTSVWFIWQKGRPRRPPHWYGPEIRNPHYWSRPPQKVHR